MSLQACPCGRTGSRNRPLPYGDCCGPLHAGAPAPDAQALMRSRYSAFVRGDVAYLLSTWHPRTRPPSLSLQPQARWLGLEVRRFVETSQDRAEVEFVARYRVEGRAVRQHERSEFLREDGRWFYLTGQVG
ncbi:YchJ family protein [Limnohabitans sp.]|uniref:YchJ family protein n=1 Tax=Limnohabitans sp. TaxID=1907725 RepID=UPI0039189FDA